MSRRAADSSGANVNPDRKQRASRSLRGGKAGRIVRALIDRRSPPGVRELAEITGVNAGYVSRVMALLDEQALIERTARGRIAAVDWPRLLERWAEDAPLSSRGRQTMCLAPRGLSATATRLRNADLRYAVTGTLAVSDLAPVAAARLLVLYVERADDAVSALEGRDALSLREAARRAGVSHNAPYRHFADRQSLLAAVAAEGFRQLAERMEAAAAHAVPGDRLREVGVAYVCFATAHPALFNLMFGRRLEGGSHPDLHNAMDRAFAVLAGQFEASEASSSGRPEIVAAWSIVHGLAHLLIDSRLGPRLTGSVSDVAALARAVLTARG